MSWAFQILYIQSIYNYSTRWYYDHNGSKWVHFVYLYCQQAMFIIVSLKEWLASYAKVCAIKVPCFGLWYASSASYCIATKPHYIIIAIHRLATQKLTIIIYIDPHLLFQSGQIGFICVGTSQYWTVLVCATRSGFILAWYWSRVETLDLKYNLGSFLLRCV